MCIPSGSNGGNDVAVGSSCNPSSSASSEGLYGNTLGNGARYCPGTNGTNFFDGPSVLTFSNASRFLVNTQPKQVSE